MGQEASRYANSALSNSSATSASHYDALANDPTGRVSLWEGVPQAIIWLVQKQVIGSHLCLSALSAYVCLVVRMCTPAPMMVGIY